MARRFVLLILLHSAIPFEGKASEQVVITAPDGFTSIVAQCGAVVVAAYRRIGQDACILRMPNKRAIHTSNQGSSTGELFRVTGMENIYQNLIRVPEVICRSHIAAFTKGDGIDIQGWQSLPGHRIGYVAGMKRLEKMLADFDVDVAATNDSLIKMLDLGRFDVAVMERLAAHETIKRLGFKGIREAEQPLNSSEFFTYVHKDRADLVPGLTAALADMNSSGATARLTERAEKSPVELDGLLCQ